MRVRRLVISVHEEGEGGFQFIGLAGGKDFVQFGGSFDGIVDAALAVALSYSGREILSLSNSM